MKSVNLRLALLLLLAFHVSAKALKKKSHGKGSGSGAAGGADAVEWKWDKWCHLQARSGNCGASMKLYYYDTMTAQCRQFMYTGCDGNQNQFSSLRDCDTFCQGVAFNPEEKNDNAAEVCSMQPNAGMCLAFMPRYYFNVNTQKCEEFIYGGCGGNANNFQTAHACMKACGTSKDTTL